MWKVFFLPFSRYHSEPSKKLYLKMLYNYKSSKNKRLTFCEAAVGLMWNYFIRSELKLHIPETQKEQAIH
jgi:hypothetical protein